MADAALKTTPAEEAELTDGFNLLIDALKLNGLTTIYGVPGIPITDFGRRGPGEELAQQIRHLFEAGRVVDRAGCAGSDVVDAFDDRIDALTGDCGVRGQGGQRRRAQFAHLLRQGLGLAVFFSRPGLAQGCNRQHHPLSRWRHGQGFDARDFDRLEEEMHKVTAAIKVPLQANGHATLETEPRGVKPGSVRAAALTRIRVFVPPGTLAWDVAYRPGHRWTETLKIEIASPEPTTDHAATRVRTLVNKKPLRIEARGAFSLPRIQGLPNFAEHGALDRKSTRLNSSYRT